MSKPQLQLLPHSVDLPFEGERGNCVTVVHRPYCRFTVHEVSATDDAGSMGSCIHETFVGCDLQLTKDGHIDDLFARPVRDGISARDFRMASYRISRFEECHPLIDITFNVSLDRTCRGKIMLSGFAWKLPDDTRETMKERAIADFEREQLEGIEKGSPTWYSVLGMTARMRQSAV